MINVIIFSKDRACQLDFLLRTFYKYFQLPVKSLFVLYDSSNTPFDDGYSKLTNRYYDESVVFVRENNFKEDLLTLFNWGDEFTMFLVDDGVFFSIVKPGPIFTQFITDKESACFSLRMGQNIKYNYNKHNKKIPVPEFYGNRWNWMRLKDQAGWSYPLSLDAHIFRTKDISRFIKYLKYDNPSVLESSMAKRAKKTMNRKPFMICYATSRFVNLAVNKVQNVYNNRYGSQYTLEFLNGEWLDNQQISMSVIENFLPSSCHIERDLRFEKQS